MMRSAAMEPQQRPREALISTRGFISFGTGFPDFF
jgi:hypothetical protein